MRIGPHSLAFRIALGATIVIAAGFTSTRVIAQTPAGDPSEKSGAPAARPAPKTPWGTPDLQGAWSNTAVVPFERPKEFGDRQFLTDAEYKKALDQLLERNKRPGRDSREIDGQDIRGTEKDVARAYNEHWFGDKPTEVGRRTSMIIDPPDGRHAGLYAGGERENQQEAASTSQALLQGTSGGKPGPISPRRNEPSPDYNLDRMNRADGPEDRSSVERCLLNGLPVILQAGPLTPDGRPCRQFRRRDADHRKPAIRSTCTTTSARAQGSIARSRSPTGRTCRKMFANTGAIRSRHWEGDTLVVDVTNFSQETDFRGSRENLHLIERYKRIDATTLQITITAEDPTTWVKPFTFVQELRKNADKPNMVYEGGCHEGNYGLLGMLANTRAAEKAFAEGAVPIQRWRTTPPAAAATNNFLRFLR